MQNHSHSRGEFRQSSRLKLSAMYSSIHVRPRHSRQFCWSGHIYEVSDAGLRFELDHPVALGKPVDVRATLPGRNATTVNLSGRIVRYHDDPDDPGPIRVGMKIDSFSTEDDRRLWLDYIRSSRLSQAA